MCLTVTKNTRIRVNKKERIVYKIIGERDGSLYSFYQKDPVKLKVPLKIDGSLKIIKEGCEVVVKEGYHSFKNMDDAINVINSDEGWAFEVAKYDNLHVFKCIIPSNTRVVRGMFDITRVSYVSDEIIYKEICYSHYKK